MPQRTGSATLPLHSGKAPRWLCGALKEGLNQRNNELGIYVAGGKGKASRLTPFELVRYGDRLGLNGERLAYNSRMAAKVDSAAVQDGFGIYHHSFFVTADGEWAVVQQGMRDADGTARRYHWLGSQVSDFVNEPHAAVASDAEPEAVLNMVAEDSSRARNASAEFARQEPRHIDREIARVITLALPNRHWVDIKRDINPAHLRKVLLSTYEASPQNFEQLLSVPGVGPKAVRALALVADVVYGSPASMKDPARYSFAHGGKDGHPYPVNREVYDGSIQWLRDAVGRARIGQTDKLSALKRLAEWQ